MLRHFTGDRGEIIVDLRFAPLYLSRWTGELSVEVVEEFFGWTAEVAREAIEQMTRVAYVNDVDGMRMPATDVRRRINELTLDMRANGSRDAMVGSWQILANPLVRGLLKAGSWITNGNMDGRVAANWSDGIAQAVLELRRVGVDVPSIDAGSYVFPG